MAGTPIIIKLFQEDDSDLSTRNLLSLMRGVYALIDQYMAHNKYPALSNTSLQTLPLPKDKSDFTYSINVKLMGGRNNPQADTAAPIIRIPLSNDLYITYVEIIEPPNTTGRRVNFPNNEIEYPAEIKDNDLSVLTRHLYNGLNELETFLEQKRDAKVKTALFQCILLFAEAARSEYVRAYITLRNTCSFTNRDATGMPGEAWTYFRQLLDWSKSVQSPRPTNDEEAEAEKLRFKKLFGTNKDVYKDFARLRFLQKLLQVKNINVSQACTDYIKFNENRNDKLDVDEYPDFQKLDDEISEAIISIQENHKNVDTKKP